MLFFCCWGFLFVGGVGFVFMVVAVCILCGVLFCFLNKHLNYLVQKILLF